MTISQSNLERIAQLSHLDTSKEETTHLSDEISAIMDFVEQLQAVDTTNIAPLYSPFNLHQALREDDVSEKSCLEQLAEIAPLFEDDLYLVPKVLDSGN